MQATAGDERQRSSLPRVLVALALLAISCSASAGDRPAGSASMAHTAQEDDDVASVAGWTRLATSASYLVVVNVLPGEPMFDSNEVHMHHPTEGELALDGVANPLGKDVRHIEAHIYDRATGLPDLDVHPAIVVTNHTTGDRIEVPATLMQDVGIGAIDAHFGNNVRVTGDSDLTLTIDIGDEEVSVDGHLD